MAEKPRLKKSDEILGSIAVEPARAPRSKKTGAASSRSGGTAQRETRSSASSESKADDELLDSEEIELNDQPVLPSAQSLAEKLLARDAKLRKVNGDFEISGNPAPQTASVVIPVPEAAPSPAQRAFEAVPVSPREESDARFAAREEEPLAAEPARQSRENQTKSTPQRGAQARGGQAPSAVGQSAQVAFEQQPAANVMEYSFQSFEDESTDRRPVREFRMQSAEDPSAGERRQPRERSRRNAEPPPTVHEPDSGFDFEFEPVVQEPVRQPFIANQPEPRKVIQPENAPEPPYAAQPPVPPPRRAPAIIQPFNPPDFDLEPIEEVPSPPPIAAERPEHPAPVPAPPKRQEPPVVIPAQPKRLEPADTHTPEERGREEFLKRLSNQFEIQFEEVFEKGALRPRESAQASEEPVREKPEPKHESFFDDAPPRRRTAQDFMDDDPNPINFRSPVQDLQTKPAPPSEEEDFLSYVQRQEKERQLREQQKPEEPAKPVEPAKRPERPVVPDDDTPASDFISKFQQEIRQEEEQRSEDFKETLAQKFMRERERYLKELKIEGDEQEAPAGTPPEQAAPSVRRKLDFQIQPEMHIREGEKPMPPSLSPSRSMTYTRGGTVKRQEYPGDDELDFTPNAAPLPGAIPSAGAKKTAEQLLLEHGLARPAVRAVQQPPAKLKFTFSTPEEQKTQQNKKREKEKEKSSILPTEKWPRRIVLTAMVSSLFALALLVWPIVKYTELSKQIAGKIEATQSESQATSMDTLNVYNDMTYTEQPAQVNNVIFKNAGVMLKNVNVSDYVVIEGIDGSGRIRLEDVSVNNAISVKACGVDTLELHNVHAARVIINNPDKEMTVNATGSTNVEVVELRTPAAVSQSETMGDSSGISSVAISAAESGGSINARLSGLSLRTLNTAAENSVLSFENGTAAETLSADGSLSLSGAGRVTTLSIGAKIGQGAGDDEQRKDVTLVVRDVAISNLNVKSPANLNLATTVDNVSTADSVLIGGGGTVGVLTINPKPVPSGRLSVEIAGMNIQNVYSNVQSRIDITGSGRVNILTCDASTYALGNKVNSLIVNADGVIYENEPDSISGIRRPQSKAENPNLDYSAGSAGASTVEATGENFATACGHSVESGGFMQGDGSKDSPFEVSSPAQLAHVASHTTSHFRQTADIDISVDSAFAGGFAPIGSAQSPFAGIYDGRGYGIAKLRIISSDENVGLFAINNGIIQNLRIISGEISSSAANLSFVGSIAGLNSEGGAIRSCSNGAAVTGNQNTYTGGITGYNFGGKVNDCYNYAKVSGVDVVGGLVGHNRQSAVLTGSYNVGYVDGREDVGSVTGINDGATVVNCYFLVETADIGIGTGNGTAIELYADEMQAPQMAADLAAGNENSLWISSNTAGYGYPVHKNPA